MAWFQALIPFSKVFIGKLWDSAIYVGAYQAVSKSQQKISSFIFGKKNITSNVGTLDMVKLNIGGKLFETSRQTILFSDSNLINIFLQNNDEKINDKENGNNIEFCYNNGIHYIDRDPKHFDYILNYLRIGDELVLPDSIKSKKELLIESQFYGLNKLNELILHELADEVISFNVGGQRYRTLIKTLNVYESNVLNNVKQNDFIDRDPQYFGYILNYLRYSMDLDNQTIILPQNKIDILCLRNEAIYYELNDLTQIIDKSLNDMEYTSHLKNA